MKEVIQFRIGTNREEIAFRETRTGEEARTEEASPNNSGMPLVHFTAQQFFLLGLHFSTSPVE
jgi:hypothetical protein